MTAGIPPRTRGQGARPHRVAVLAYDGVVLGDLSAPCELFTRARDRAGRGLYQVRVCSARPKVTTEHVRLEVPWRLRWLARADTVIVPGPEHPGAPVPAEVLGAIRRAARRGARVASICTGAFLLAEAGVLRGLRATTHWLGAAELARRYPEVAVDPDVLYIDNGQVLTSAGAAAGHDLCLHLIRRDFGADLAAEVARAAVLPLERPGGQAQFIVRAPPAPEGTPMALLLERLDRCLHEELGLSEIARLAAMSTRTLSRRFREQVGTTPAQWLGHARVRRAQRLLETTDLSIERLAAEAGFRSAAVLRERFRQVVGTSPQEYRRSYRPAAGQSGR